VKNQSHRMINGKMAKPVPDVLNTWARIDGTIWYKCMRGKSKGKYLKRKTFKSNCGYQTITIGNMENRKTKNLHIVLLEAWFGKRPAKNYQGAHWDGNKSNNALDNLRWAKNGSFDDVKNAPNNSFFECSNQTDSWFHAKTKEIESNPNTRWKRWTLEDKPKKDVAYG